MAITPNKPTVFPATAKHTATVIFVHGLGDTSDAWAATIEDWRQQEQMDEVKFLLPNAPTRPITWNKGQPMTGWFDITNVGGSVESFRENEDVDGIMESREYFQQLVKEEIDAGIDPERIVLGGFSQGGAMSILSGLTADVKLGGIISLSAWLLRSEEFEELVPEEKLNQETPIFMGQGTDDRMVKPVLGKQSYDMLKRMDYDVTWEVYPDMGHSACMEELEDVQAFIEDQLPPLEA